MDNCYFQCQEGSSEAVDDEHEGRLLWNNTAFYDHRNVFSHVALHPVRYAVYL
jgi:hypothetical protein